MLVSFADASLIRHSDAVSLDLDATANRAISNRAHVGRHGDDVLAEAKRLALAGPSEARRLVAESTVSQILDGHQAVNVAVMTVRNGWGTCVFDEQGTGKTVTVLGAFDLLVERGEADVLIVVSPKSMIAEWAEEFRRFTQGLYKVAVVDGSRDERLRALSSGADVLVVNYESVSRFGETLRLVARRSHAVLVVDESFFVKNPEASRTRAVKSLREWCDRCFVLCGTPAPNSPADLVAQFDLVDFGRTFEGTRIDDTDRVAAARQVRGVLDARGFYVRSLKSEVLQDLPGRSFMEVNVSLAPQQRRAYDAALNDLVLDLRETSDRDFDRNLTSFLERRAMLLRICSDPTPVVPGYDETPGKIDALDGILEDLVEVRAEKTVIWSFYRTSLDRLASRYSRYGLVRIDGSVTSSSARREAVRRFQEDNETMIFLGNPAAAGAGLTLHRARFALYESLSNQAAHFLQSLDRIHRRGQERETEYVTLLASETLEQGEYRRLLQKADRQADLLRDAAEPRVTRELMLSDLLGHTGARGN